MKIQRTGKGKFTLFPKFEFLGLEKFGKRFYVGIYNYEYLGTINMHIERI